MSHSFLFLCFSTALLAQAKPSHLHLRDANPFPITTQPPDYQLHPRQALQNPGNSTCGYRNGNLEKSWVAPEGSRCYADHTASIFGWCNALLKDADCTQVPRACEDSSTCSTGCGRVGTSGLRTLSCSQANSYCYSNLLVTGDQTYTWLGCDKTRTPLIYSPAVGILDAVAPSSASATPTNSPSSSTGAAAASTASGAFQPGTAATSASPSQTGNPQPNNAQSPSSTATPASSSSTSTGAIAGGLVGGLAVLALAGLGFYFIRRRTNKKAEHGEAAEIDDKNIKPWDEKRAEAYTYHSELPGPIAAAEMGIQEPAELYGDTIPGDKKKHTYQ